MATTTKQYLDLNGLKYLLSKLNYTKPADAGKFLTGLTESKGIISGEWANLTKDDIPAIGTPTDYQIKTKVGVKTGVITNTITKDDGTKLEAYFRICTSGSIGMLRNDSTGDLIIEYDEKVSGVKKDGYLTLDYDPRSGDNLLDINSAKLADASTDAGAVGTLLTTKAYVDKQVSAAIAGGVQYKGTTATLPNNPANGDMWKLTANIESIKGSKAGDVIIYHTSGTPGWDLIPSGDDVEYTGIKVGDTTVIGATTGGDATFAAGEGLSVAGAAGTVTYSHATTGVEKTSGFYKIATDKFGHVTGAVEVAKADITGLLGDYVSTIGGKSGAITLKAASNTNGAINLSISDAGELSAAIVGLGSAAFANTDAFAAAAHTHEIADVNGLQNALNGKQAAFTDGTATIASVAAGVVTLKAGIAQDGGKIANNAAADITLAKVATTGNAEDVLYSNTASKLTATKVQGAIDELVTKIAGVEAKAGVTSFGGQKGDITVNTTGAANGSINFAVGTDNKLTGTVAGWDAKQDAFQDGSAAIVTTAADSAVQTAGAENSTSTTIKSVTQTKGTIGVSAEAVVEFKTISNKDIDGLFA